MTKLHLVTPPPPPPPDPSTSTPAIVRVSALTSIAYVDARHYRRGKRRDPAIWIVLHATHGAEGRSKAEDCARMFATLPGDTKQKKSSTLVIDTDSVVQCVPFECEAYHGGANANRYGEGIELCGSADQTRAQWLDALSLPMLAIAAGIVRWRCDVLGIPPTFRSATDLRAHAPGITTHREISRAFPQDTDHYDPGPHFPIDEFVAAVAR